MKRRLATLATMLIFSAGCAPVLLHSTPRTVLIGNADAFNTVETQKLADEQCQKHNRYAIHRPDNTRDGKVAYECIE
ncbi:MAG: hypothetical protein HOG74_01445 [Nitrospina sp.]|jgi:hypothetical protein|nr:hypothetical protein [Nitrospina sp.]